MCVHVGESLHNAKIMWVGTGQFIENSYNNFGVGIAHPGPTIDPPLPVVLHKIEGPATTLTFLGIEVDNVLSQLHLPESKLKLLKRDLEKGCFWH